MFTGFVLVICFIVIGMMWPEGLWSNALTFINTLFSGIVAWNYFEPFAGFLEENLPSFTYIVDYLAFWLIFAIFFNVTRAVTDQISKKKARFRKPVDVGGGATFAFLTAFLMVLLICSSIHFAPLQAAPFGGGFKSQGKDAGSFLGMKVEQMWLSTMFRLSAKKNGKPAGAFATKGTNAFDPGGNFAKKYYLSLIHI